MSEELERFVRRVGERKNSAAVKLNLLVYGIQDAPEVFAKFSGCFKEEHYAYDNGNWNVDKARLTPTEVLLPGGIVSKLHIRPDSPLTLVEDKGRIFIKEGNKFLSELMFLERPKFWDYTTKAGTPTKNLAQIYGYSALNFNIFSDCEFHTLGKGCRFCSVRATVDKDSPVEKEKSIADLSDVCELATRYDSFRYVIITGGSYLDREIEFQRNIELLKAVRHKLPWNGFVKGNVSFLPPRDYTKLKAIHELGVENPSFNMEVWDKTNFTKVCPGKAEYVGFEHIVQSLLFLAEVYEKGQVWSNFVAGIVPLEDLKAGFNFMAEHGIVPGANIYHAEVGSVFGNKVGRISKEYILSLYRHGAELYYKYGYKPYFDTCVLRNSVSNEVYEGLL